MHPIEEKWNDIKTYIREEYELSPISYNTWIEPLSFYKEKDDMIYIVIRSDQSNVKEYITKKYRTYFQVAVSEVMNRNYDVTFVLEKVLNPAKDNDDADLLLKMNVEKAKLNPKYTFDTFVVGENNSFAHATALTVSETPGDIYNPLFIYGGSGLGKTHLMNAIGHFILKSNPEMKVLFVDSERFTNELIQSIRSGNTASMSNLRDKYRNVDVLLLDDVQFIVGKESTQEEFFHTFNTLYNAGKQIVLTSDKPPKEYTTLDERFRSRFEWGLIAEIQAPDYETRVAILRKNLEIMNENIDDEIIRYIAENVNTNIRQLDGALTKVLAGARLHPDAGITLETVMTDLRDIIMPTTQRVLTPEFLLELVTEHFSVTIDDIASRKRNAAIVVPRQLFMFLCREYLDLPYQGIGKYVGGRDHATVIHGIKKLEKEMEEDTALAGRVEALKRIINASVQE